MHALTLFALAAAARLTSAHATVYSVWVNDVDQGLATTGNSYIRYPPSNSPITDVTSDDMTCNVNNKPTAKTIKVKGGDKITFEWHHDSRSPTDIIDPSHVGPILTYIAPTSSDGQGNVWVKLAEDGYKDDTWAVETLIANKGMHSITLPNLKPGKYLLRDEIIALHEGFNIGGAQFYMECIQVEVTSQGSLALPAGVAIPGTYKAEDPGVHFDLYNGFTSYPIPGPKVWKAKKGGSSPNPTKTKSKTLKPTTPAGPTQTMSTYPSSSYGPSSMPTSSCTTSYGTGPTGAPGTVPLYGQCGGQNYHGSTTCAAGSTCQVQNQYYSQCL